MKIKRTLMAIAAFSAFMESSVQSSILPNWDTMGFAGSETSIGLVEELSTTTGGGGKDGTISNASQTAILEPKAALLGSIGVLLLLRRRNR